MAFTLTNVYLFSVFRRFLPAASDRSDRENIVLPLSLFQVLWFSRRAGDTDSHWNLSDDEIIAVKQLK